MVEDFVVVKGLWSEHDRHGEVGWEQLCGILAFNNDIDCYGSEGSLVVVVI